MKRLFVLIVALTLIAASTASAATTWSFVDDYSATHNPNGVWSYGRTWNASVSTINVFGARWQNNSGGGSGWYLGGTTWQPSIGDWGAVWADNNSHGYPVIRWTAPETGWYELTGSFTVSDSRGGDNLVYVAINNTIQFTDRITGYRDTASFDIDNIYLTSGSTINLVSAWAGGTYRDYGWVSVNAEISTVPLPATGLLMGSVLPVLIAAMRFRKKILL